MAKLMRERLFNNKKLLLAGIFFIGLFIAYLFSSGLYELLFNFDVNAPDLQHTGGEQVRQDLIQGRLKIFHYMDNSGYMNTVVPILIFAFSIFFFQEKNSVFLQKYVRGQSEKKVIISSLCSHSGIVAVYFYIAYLLYLSIGWLTMKDLTSPIPLNSFDPLFGSGFSERHLFLYYVIAGFFKVFLMAFVYCFFSCAIALVVRKAYLAILFASIYYFGLTLTLSLGGIFRPLMSYIQPAMIQGFDCYVYDPVLLIDSFRPLITLLIPTAISIILVVFTLKRREKIAF